MQIHHKDKPSVQALKNYKQKLENFLAALNVSIVIELWEEPLRIESYINNIHDSTDYHWIKDIKISTLKIKDLSVYVYMMSEGIDEDMSDASIWNDAFYIQEQIYKHAGINPKLPSSTSSDPYWKLWDYVK